MSGAAKTEAATQAACDVADKVAIATASNAIDELLSTLGAAHPRPIPDGCLRRGPHADAGRDSSRRTSRPTGASRQEPCDGSRALREEKDHCRDAASRRDSTLIRSHWRYTLPGSEIEPGSVSNRMNARRFRKPEARLHSCLAHPGPMILSVPPCIWFRPSVPILDRARLFSDRLFLPVFKAMILG